MFYASSGFKKVAADNAAFLSSLSDMVGSRSTNMTNMMSVGFLLRNQSKCVWKFNQFAFYS